MTHHYRRPAIAASGNRSSRSFALGFVIVMHAGLVIAIGSGMRVHVSPLVFPDLTTTVIEPPVTPPIDRNWQPPTTTTVTPPGELPPFDYSAESGPTDAITTTIARSKQIDPLPAQPVIVPPKIDPRHPLSQPAYPASARRAGIEGSVKLSLYVLANGRIGDAKIVRGSGSEELDDAAVKEALRTWQLLPQRVDGTAVAAWYDIAVKFQLKN